MNSGAGVVVVGGGWAGLSCAVALAHSGTPVTLLEERRRLGGRAYSFRDPSTGDEVDNGQHLFMGCFAEGLRFLSRIGTDRGIVFQENLHVPVLDPAGRSTALRCPRLPAPLHLLAGILRHSGLAPADRLGILRSWSAVGGRSARGIGGSSTGGPDGDPSVEEWLDDLSQTAGSRRVFWRPLAVAALNEDSRRASSRLFRTVLREGLLGGRAASRLGFPRVPLSRLIEPAREFIERRGGRVILNAGVVRLVLEDGRIGRVRLRDGSEIAASELVCAIPPAALRRILPERIAEGDPGFAALGRLETSPILTVHLWYDREVLDFPFVGLLDSPVHWMFRSEEESPPRPGSRLTLVTSSARDLVDRPAAELAKMAAGEVRRFIPQSAQAALRQARVIKERQATFASVAGVESLRPPHRTSVPNLFLAGDWTGTGLPGTLESAARSGHRCAAILRPGADRAA